MVSADVRISEKVRRRLKRPIRRMTRWMGYELVPRTRDESAILTAKMASLGIDLLLDVGANQGQYAERMRAAGYGSEIISFEPGSDAFRYLQRAARADDRWHTHRIAVGSAEGEVLLHVSGNSVSSSLLPIGRRHLDADTRSQTVGSERVRMVRLDREIPYSGRKTMLKIDTQGYELAVLRGAEKLLGQIELLQIEVSLVELYEGQAGYLEVLAAIHELGFVPRMLLPGFSDPVTGDLLQLDVVATREK